MLICIQIVFPSLVQPLEEQEEFGCSTSHRTQANHWLTVGWTEIKKKMERLVGGRDRDRKNIRVEERNPHNRNHSLRSQAGNRCEERCRESRRRLLAGALTSVPRDRPLRYLIQTWSWASAKNLPSRSPLGQASSHTHPSHTAFPPRNPFSDLTSPTGQAQSWAPYSKGRVLRPEAGNGAVRTCSEEAAGRLARRHGAAVPTNAQVRAASGSGLGSAREARGLGALATAIVVVERFRQGLLTTSQPLVGWPQLWEGAGLGAKSWVG